MWNFPGFGSTTTMENAVIDLLGVQNADLFFDRYRSNYITEKDISFLAENGFNALRVPLHYKHFSPSFNEFTEIGFDLLEPIINACRENDMYVVLDMHAAPGAQNTSDFQTLMSKRRDFSHSTVIRSGMYLHGDISLSTTQMSR